MNALIVPVRKDLVLHSSTRGLAILATLLLMVMVGGPWVSSFIFPPWPQTVSLCMPTHWAVDGLGAKN